MNRRFFEDAFSVVPPTAQSPHADERANDQTIEKRRQQSANSDISVCRWLSAAFRTGHFSLTKVMT
jgi:hypothetical protein